MNLNMKWRIVERGSHYFLEYKKFLFWRHVRMRHILTTKLSTGEWDTILPSPFATENLIGFHSKEIAEKIIPILDNNIYGAKKVIKTFEPVESVDTFEDVVKREG